MPASDVRNDLAAIRTLMLDSQRLVRGTWRHQLVWGLLTTVGLSATWVADRQGRYAEILAVWLVVLALGWGFSLFPGRPGRDEEGVRNVATRAFGGIWIALGVTLTLLGLVSIPLGVVDPLGLPGVIAVILGAGYFATGFVAELRWMIAVGVGWWIGGLGLLWWRSPDAMLALALMAILLEVVPALALRRSERRETPTG